VFSLLKDKFVVGWKNIQREDYVGSSHGYTCSESAVGTTNGAGPRNTQTFVLSSDGVVLHCLPGFWHHDDLAYELELARVLHRLWKDARPTADKRAMFARMHLRAIRVQPAAMLARSGWQGFDAQHERKRLESGQRDTFYYQDGKPTTLKPLSVVLHERMAARPFVAYRKFDTEGFIDYGRPYYDNNAGVAGRGVSFGSKGYMASQKRMAERNKKRAEEKARVAAYYGKKPEVAPELQPKPTKAKARPETKSNRGAAGAPPSGAAPQRPTSRPSKRRGEE
jgi:hypothetical protein